MHDVSVLQREGGNGLPHHVQRFAVEVVDALHVHAAPVGNVRVTAGVVQGRAQIFVRKQFKEHGAFHLAFEQHAFFVGGHKHHVALLKLRVFGHFTGDQQGIQIQRFHGFAPTDHLNVAVGAFPRRSAGDVEGMQGGGQRRQVVLAGFLHSHQGDVDGAHGFEGYGQFGLSGGQRSVAVLREVGTDFGGAVLQSQTAEVHHPGVGYGDVPLRGDLSAGAVFLTAVHKDVQHVPRAQNVVRRGGNVQRGRKVEVALLKQVCPKNQGVHNAVFVQFAQLDGLGDGVLPFFLLHRRRGGGQVSKRAFVGKNLFLRQLRYWNGGKGALGKDVLCLSHRGPKESCQSEDAKNHSGWDHERTVS